MLLDKFEILNQRMLTLCFVEQNVLLARFVQYVHGSWQSSDQVLLSQVWIPLALSFRSLSVLIIPEFKPVFDLTYPTFAQSRAEYSFSKRDTCSQTINNFNDCFTCLLKWISWFRYPAFILWVSLDRKYTFASMIHEGETLKNPLLLHDSYEETDVIFALDRVYNAKVSNSYHEFWFFFHSLIDMIARFTFSSMPWGYKLRILCCSLVLLDSQMQ